MADTIAADMPTLLQSRSDGPEYSMYTYSVSEAAAAVFCALFATSGLLAIYQSFRTRAWIWIVMLIAIGGEVGGYATRILSANDTSSRPLYSASFTMVVLPPVLMAGIIYVVFGRIVFLVVPPQDRRFRLLWAPARWLTPIFVGFDIISLLMQLIGALMLTKADPMDSDFKDQLDRGRIIGVGGVVVQLVAFGFFSIVAGRFHWVSKRFGDAQPKPLVDAQGVSQELPPAPPRRRLGWKHLLLAVNASCILILVRSVYRLIEFIEGKDGYIMNNEWPLYVLDAAPMLAVCILFNIVPPGKAVNMGFRQRAQRRRDEGTELR